MVYFVTLYLLAISSSQFAKKNAKIPRLLINSARNTTQWTSKKKNRKNKTIKSEEFPRSNKTHAEASDARITDRMQLGVPAQLIMPASASLLIYSAQLNRTRIIAYRENQVTLYRLSLSLFSMPRLGPATIINSDVAAYRINDAYASERASERKTSSQRAYICATSAAAIPLYIYLYTYTCTHTHTRVVDSARG